MKPFCSLLTIGILGGLLAAPPPLMAGSFSYSSSAFTAGGSDATEYRIISGSRKSHQAHRSFDRRHFRDFDRRHFRSHDHRSFDRYYSRDFDRRHFRSPRYHDYDHRFRYSYPDVYRSKRFYRYDRGHLNYRVCYRSGSAIVCLR